LKSKVKHDLFEDSGGHFGPATIGMAQPASLLNHRKVLSPISYRKMHIPARNPDISTGFRP
jgi:hypothetical protein